MKKNLKIILVDDESESRVQLRNLIHSMGNGFEVMGEAKDALSALKLIKMQKPDIIITEIALADGNGFDILDCLTSRDIAVIITTTLNDYALKAFGYNVVDYLIKPLVPEKVLLALKKAQEKCTRDFVNSFEYSKLINGRVDDHFKLSIHSQNEIEFIDIKTIVRLEAEGCYTHIFLNNGRKITVTKSLGDYESILLNEKFVRVHNSHIVNLKHIKKFLKKDGLILQMIDDYLVPIAIRRKDIFENKMKLLVI